MTAPEELAERLADLDEEFREGIERALAEDPDALRVFLLEEGFLEDGDVVEHGQPELSDAEAALLEVVEDLGTPKSTDEIRDIIEVEYPEKLEEYGSFKHRTWINSKLNSLAKKGYVGKYREGRKVMFTPDPEEAVRRWALHNNRFVEELDPGDSDEIVADTGMNRLTVKRAIRNLSEEP